MTIIPFNTIKFALTIIIIALFTISITAQQAWTNVTTVDCLNGDTIEMTPSQGAQAFCSQSNNIPCQDAIRMGYPNAFGSVSGAEPNGPFKFHQQLTGAPLYVVISDFQGRPAHKTRFFLQVDRYSLLELGGTAGNADIDVDPFIDNQPIDETSAIMMNNTLIQVEFGGFTTPVVRRTFIPPVNPLDVVPVTNQQRRVVTFYTLIIELDRGMVKDLFWQEGCYGCGSSQNCWREPDVLPWCTTQYSDCSVVDLSAGSGVSCNIKIYVGWQGTDADGNYLMSAQSSIKNFLQFAVSTPFESAQNIFGQLGPGSAEEGGL